MESVLWNLRTLSGFSTLAPMIVILVMTLTAFWDYPLLLLYSLTSRAIGRSRKPPPYVKALPALVVIPKSSQRKEALNK